MSFNLHVIVKYFPFLLQGALLTVELTLLGTALGLVLGLALALMKISPFKLLRWIADFYVWIIRGTPLLVQLFLIYFGLPQFGIEISAFASSILGLGINSGAYISEVFRGGIESVPIGQTEAARSLGMSNPLAMRRIIFPQALRVSLPPLGNQFIIGLKDSSLCSVITMSELLQTSQRFASVNFAFIEFYTAAAALYLVMTTIIAFGIKSMEKRLAVSQRSRGFKK